MSRPNRDGRRVDSPLNVMSVAGASSLAVLGGCFSSKTAAGSDGEYLPPGNFDALPDASPPGDASGASDALSAPMTGAGAFRVVAGPAELLKNGPPCTSEAGSPSDTWCAFSAAGGDVHDCMPARVGNAVVCVHDLPVSPPVSADAPASTAINSELLVGTVDAASPVLPAIATVISSDSADNQQRFQVQIVGAQGERIAWSSRAVPGGPEILNQQLIGDPTTRQVVAPDETKWTISKDGTHWGWLSAYNYNSSAPSGTLQVANFPDGSNPVTVQPLTATYAFTVGSGLADLATTNVLTGLVDPVNAPADAMQLDSGVISILSVSKLGHVAYVKKYDFVFGLVDLYVQKYDRTSILCSLDRLEEVPYGAGLTPRFLPGGTALLWSRVTNLDTTDTRLMAAGRFT